MDLNSTIGSLKRVSPITMPTGKIVLLSLTIRDGMIWSVKLLSDMFVRRELQFKSPSFTRNGSTTSLSKAEIGMTLRRFASPGVDIWPLS
jgi:hypothetical protein